MSDRLFTAADAFRTSRAGVVLFYGYLVAILISGFLLFSVIQNVSSVTDQAHKALCAQRLSYQTRLDTAQKVLPMSYEQRVAFYSKQFGLPLARQLAAIPDPVIANSISGLKQSISALGPVHNC